MASGPKMKTKRAAAKRFTITGSGRFKRGASKRRHIMTNKSRKLKRHLRADKLVRLEEQSHMKRMLPYL